MCRENYSIRTQILSYVRRGNTARGCAYVWRRGILNLIACATEEEHTKPICVGRFLLLENEYILLKRAGLSSL